MKRFLRFTGAWIALFIIFIISVSLDRSYFSLLVPVLMLVPVWMINDKKRSKGTEVEKIISRIYHYKEYKIRVYVSIMILFIGLLSVLGGVSSNRDIHAGKIYANTPDPLVKILSASGYIGNITGYTLIFSSTGSDTVKVNDSVVYSSGGLYSVNVPLITPSISISIVASNSLKSNVFTVNVNRDKTPIEIEAEKQAEIQRLEQEKIAEKQRLEAQKQQQLLEAKESRIKAKYESIAKNGYLYQIEKKLFDRDFKQFSSEFATAPDGSTQVETIYVNNIEGCYVEIALQNSYSLDSHYYSVKVECK